MAQRTVDERHLEAAHDDGGVDGVRLVVELVKTPRLGSEAGQRTFEHAVTTGGCRRVGGVQHKQCRLLDSDHFAAGACF